MTEKKFKKVPLEYNFKCRKCNSTDIEYRIPDNDGCYEDYEYHCLSCNRYWWVDGADS